MHILKWILPFVSILFVLTGCQGKSELESRAYVVVLGLDKADDHSIQVTFQIANPQVGSTDVSLADKEPASDIVTVTAPDILSAKDLANSIVPRKLTFSHLVVIVVGQDFAESDLFRPILSSATIDPEIRRETNLLVSKEKAKTFIQTNKSKMETRPHKYYFFMQQRWKDTGYVPDSTLNRYFQRLSGPLFLAAYASVENQGNTEDSRDYNYLAGEVPKQFGDPAQMIGSAVFKDGKMIGTMGGRDTRIALSLREKESIDSVITSYPDPVNPKNQITVRIMKKQHAKIKINTKQEPVVVQVSIPLDLQVFSNPAQVNYGTNEKNQKLLKQSIKRDMEKNATKLIERTQMEFKSEPFKWYLQARKNFLTIQEYEKYNWEEKYKDAIVKIDYDLTIQSLGEQLKPVEAHLKRRGG